MAELANTPLSADANLIAYYRMESGLLTTDSKGSNTLTNTGTVADGTGIFGGAADFGTANSTKGLSRADNLGIAGNGDLSVSFWLKMNTEISNPQTEVFFIHTSTTTQDRYFQIYYDNTGTKVLNIDAGGSSVQSNQTLGTDSWHHIVGIRSGGNVSAYLDNISLGSLAVGATGLARNDIYIGEQGSASHYYSSVLVDDMGIFNRALTAAEIQTLYSAGTSGLMNKIW